MNIEGMGEETIDLLLSKKFIRNVADIYTLPFRREELVGLEKIVYPENFEMTSIPLGKIIYAFEIGLKNISARNAEGIAEYFGSLGSVFKGYAGRSCLRWVDEGSANRILDYSGCRLMKH